MSLTSIASPAGVTPPIAAPAAVPSATSRRAATPMGEPAVPALKSVSKPTPADLQQAVDTSNQVLASKTSNELHFAVEKGTGLAVVSLINQKTGETLLQFPSEAMLEIAKGIDQVTGAIIQRKV